MTGEITAGNLEQTRDVTQLVSAVGPMNRSIQHRPALAEQLAAAAERLEHRAQPLARAVGVHRQSVTRA